MTLESFRGYILRRKAKRGTWQAFAGELNVPVSQLHMAAMGKKEPEPKLLKALGFEEVVMYKKTKKDTP